MMQRGLQRIVPAVLVGAALLASAGCDDFKRKVGLAPLQQGEVQTTITELNTRMKDFEDAKVRFEGMLEAVETAYASPALNNYTVTLTARLSKDGQTLSCTALETNVSKDKVAYYQDSTSGLENMFTNTLGVRGTVDNGVLHLTEIYAPSGSKFKADYTTPPVEFIGESTRSGTLNEFIALQKSDAQLYVLAISEDDRLSYTVLMKTASIDQLQALKGKRVELRVKNTVYSTLLFEGLTIVAYGERPAQEMKAQEPEKKSWMERLFEL